MRILLLISIVLTLSIAAAAQDGTAPARRPHIEVPTVPARAEDVSTLDGIVRAFYETITGPAGQPRQWGRDRSLYIPGVRFVSTDERNGKTVVSVMDHQQYVDAVDGYFVKEGFFEKEIGRAVNKFGNITHVFSAYESRNKADGPVMERGVNSIELVYDGTRWWIAAATWDSERPNNPIPKDLLPVRK